MKVTSYEAIVRTLTDSGVPFIVVGGLAVVAHGYGRNTFDVDLVIQLQEDCIKRAFAALERPTTALPFPSQRRNSATRNYERDCAAQKIWRC